MFESLFGRARAAHQRFATKRSHGGKRAKCGFRRIAVVVDVLEDRCLPSVFNVTGLGDGLFPVTRTGSNTFKAPTLRSAIEAANATPGNNTINLTRSGTYEITISPAAPDDTPATENNASGDFDIIPNASSPAGSTLTIVNTSGDKAAVSANGLDRIFDINPNNATAPADLTLVLQGFTIENGIASPGDGVAGSGGAIRDQGNVNLTLTHMVVNHNRATADGGGLVMFNMTQGSWTLKVDHSTISDNHAGDAGGGIDTDGTGTVVIDSSLVTGNTDINQGAGVYVDVAVGSTSPAGANMTMTNTVVSNNSALAFSITASGGGISNAGNGSMTIDHSTIENNFTAGMGGGFSDENNNGTLAVRDSLFLNNTASMSGGGIQEGGPNTSITNTEFKGNSSGGSGGALFANGTTLTVRNSTFVNNTAAGGGGGIEVETSGTMSAGSAITNATITGNSALNNAGANGGGIDAVTLGSLALLNDTINANFANNGGGVFWDGSGTFSVQNTIIAANSAGVGGTGPDANNPAGTFTDKGGNLIGVSGAGSGNTGFTASTTQTGTVAHPLDPLLGPPQNNGGPKIGAPGTTITLETEAPLKGSPAIGKGILSGAPSTDERGFPSVVHGKINVGAVSQAHSEHGKSQDEDDDGQDENDDRQVALQDHGQQELFSVSSDDGLFLHTASGGWQRVGAAGTIQSISGVTDAAGNGVLFVVTSDGGLFRYSAAGWAQIGGSGTIRSISAGTDATGQANVFVLTATNAFFGFSHAGWAQIGAANTVQSMTASSQGRVVVVTADDSVFEYGPNSGWLALTSAGFAQSVQAVADASGNVVVYAVTQDNALFMENLATGWRQLGASGTIQSIAAGTDATGLADVYALTANGTLFRNGASGWSNVDPGSTVLGITAGSSDRAFAVIGDGSLFARDDSFGWYRLTGTGFATA